MYGTGLYTVLMIVIGGILGAFVFGIYWVVTSLLFGMHQDSFSALGIRNYKNFLRMKFEKDKLTIYPIALDKVPGRLGWQEREQEDRQWSADRPEEGTAAATDRGPDRHRAAAKREAAERAADKHHLGVKIVCPRRSRPALGCRHL